MELDVWMDHLVVGCDEFTGTTSTCKNFKGLNGTSLCWSTSTTPAPCIDRLCTHLSGTTNTDC